MASDDGAGVPAGVIEWGQLIVNGTHPAPRGGHTCAAADGQLVIFGGHCYEGKGKFTYYNDTHVFDTESSTWHAVPCRGELPKPRYGHSATLVGSRMYVFGGKGPEGVYRDMHFLDLIEWTWVPVNATTVGPSPRFNHASALVGRKLVIHGGWDGAKLCLDDLWVFDTDNFNWLHPKTGGLAPSKRHGHSLELLPDGRLVCFGGCKVDGTAIPEYYNDLRQLDTETMVWAKPRTQGELFPSGRYGHSTMQLGDQLVVFGGWGLGGLQSKQDNPSRKGAETVFAIDTGSMTFWAPAMPEHTLPHRYGSTLAVVENVVFMFGGWTGKQAVSDVVSFQLAMR